MRKFLGFILWWGAFIAGTIFFMQSFIVAMDESADAATTPIILAAVLWLISGVGRRVFHIKDTAVENVGLVTCLIRRLFCKRFFVTVFMYAGLSALMISLFKIAYASPELTDIIIAIVGFIVMSGARGVMSYTCSHCGHGLVMDDRDYDDSVSIEYTSSSATASRYSTDYYHCPRCGHQSRIRVKHTAAKVHY